jgi:hypothetical protein
MHAHACNVAAPVLGARAQLAQVVAERLANEPALAHKWHLIFDACFALRPAHARRVDEKSRDCAYSTNDGWMPEFCASARLITALILSSTTV